MARLSHKKLASYWEGHYQGYKLGAIDGSRAERRAWLRRAGRMLRFYYSAGIESLLNWGKAREEKARRKEAR